MNASNVDISATRHIHHKRRLAIVVLGSRHYPATLKNIVRAHPRACQCRIVVAKEGLGRANSQHFQQHSLQLRVAHRHSA
eukprot:5592617-Karenia_brevis.AAC.1